MQTLQLSLKGNRSRSQLCVWRFHYADAKEEGQAQGHHTAALAGWRAGA
jgi:hypothetical protein